MACSIAESFGKNVTPRVYFRITEIARAAEILTTFLSFFMLGGKQVKRKEMNLAELQMLLREECGKSNLQKTNTD
jgi:hypothetical protein